MEGGDNARNLTKLKRGLPSLTFTMLDAAYSFFAVVTRTGNLTRSAYLKQSGAVKHPGTRHF